MMAACTEAPDPERWDPDAYPFVEFPWEQGAPDVRTDRLCGDATAPLGPDGDVYIDCRLEGADLRTSPADPTAAPLVMAYNLERGLRLDDQIAWLTGPDSPRPDVMLVSEADRGCSRTGYRNVLREIADALGMVYVFGVEFVELPRESGSGGRIDAPCEHGNGILSRYPLGNVRLMRFAHNLSWYIPPEDFHGDGEPRLGGRMAVVADARIGDRILHLYALHLESTIDEDIRSAQAEELAVDGLTRPYRVVQGGDTNAGLYFLDLIDGTTVDTTTQAWLSRGYLDTHAAIPYEQRGTHGDLPLDLIFTNRDRFDTGVICDRAICGDLSDHLPVWVTFHLGG